MAKSLKIKVADRIREILTEKGLKQQDLADRTGLTKSYISLILSAHVNLTLETIELLEKALRASIVTIER